MEKEPYGVPPDRETREKYSNESPPFEDPSRVVETKGIRIGEAADMYGDLATAEDYGYVTRGCVETRIRVGLLGLMEIVLA